MEPYVTMTQLVMEQTIRETGPFVNKWEMDNVVSLKGGISIEVCENLKTRRSTFVLDFDRLLNYYQI